MQKQVAVYGTDYQTADGTGIRDYVHVEDLASAHLAAIDHLLQGHSSVTLNVGYGVGHSVREVIETTRRVTGINFATVDAPRRLGDPAMLVASAQKIRQILNWVPQHASLEEIVTDAWRWESRLARSMAKTRVTTR
jgi:UDP-glucose 4-epimerase